MTQLISALLLLLCLCTFATVATTEPREIIGEGRNSCGAWTEERSRDDTKSVLHRTWLLGFLSGQNATDLSQADFLKHVDAQAIYGWIDNYCRANPLDPIALAAYELVNVLRRKAVR